MIMLIIIFSSKSIKMGSHLMNFDTTGIKLDEICTPNPFLMLLMARDGLQWPFKGHLRPLKIHVDHHIFQLITAFHWKYIYIYIYICFSTNDNQCLLAPQVMAFEQLKYAEVRQHGPVGGAVGGPVEAY